MPQCLCDECQVDVTSDEMWRQRVFQHVGMALVGSDANFRRHCLEHAEELSAVESAAFLWSEQVIRAVARALAEPRPECGDLIE